jgi:hypothetical protein
MVIFLVEAGCLDASAPPTSVGGGGASVLPLSPRGADGGHSLPEIVRVALVPESAEQQDRDEGQERVVQSESHSSDGQKKAEAAEEAVDDDF